MAIEVELPQGRCVCTHLLVDHSGAREDDFRCLSAGCGCRGWEEIVTVAHVVSEEEERVRYDGIALRDLFRKEDGRVYRVVSIATDPTVQLREVGAPDDAPTENYVIRSPLFAQRFEHLVPKGSV